MSEQSEDVDDFAELDERQNFMIPKQWESDTIDKTNEEILSQYMTPNRKILRIEFSKKWHTFGGDLNLQDKDNEGFGQIQALNTEKKGISVVNKRVNEIGLQASNPLESKAAQTDWKKKKNISVQCCVEQNKVEIKSDNHNFTGFLRRSYALMEEALCANETIDIFMNDFKLFNDSYNGDNSGATELSIIKEIKSFEFQDCKKKLISCIRFQKKTSIFARNIMATSFVEDLSFDERIEIGGRSYPNKILLWDFKDMHLFVPVIILLSTIEITVFEFKPHDPNIIIAGAINGQLLLWDLTRYLNPTHSSYKSIGGNKDTGETPTISPVIFSSFPSNYSIPPVIPPEGFNRKIVNSHKTVITSINFLPNKIEIDRKRFSIIENTDKSVRHQFTTTSYDGQIMFWDTRFQEKTRGKIIKTDNTELKPNYHMQWKAIFSVQLYRFDGTPLGCSQIRFLKDQETTTFYGTSDEGELFFANWSTKKSDEASKSEMIKQYWEVTRNMRPTIDLCISPFYDDLLMTIHDCNFFIWKVDCEEPVFRSPTIEKTFITCGFFSAQRPGVIFIGREDGKIDIWDFLDQSNSPTQQHLVVAIGINSMKINPNQHEMLAVGDRDGCLHLLKLPVNLVRSINHEKQSIQQFFEREKKRVEYFKNRFEIRAIQYQEQFEVRDTDYGMDNFSAQRNQKKDEGNTKEAEELKIEQEYLKFVDACFAPKEENAEEENKEDK